MADIEVDCEFRLRNWSSSASRALLRGGMPFKKGEIPAGKRPEIRVGGVAVAAQFDERATWSDGSLRFAVAHIRDTDVAGSAERTYQVFSVDGGFDNTGATTLASVAASNALTVEISNFLQWNGTVSAQRGGGAALASLAAHAAVATRVTKIHSGPVCEGWVVWGMVKDGAAGDGAEDAHLKVIWHVDVWKDAGGVIIDTEFGAVMAQDWWGVAEKYRLDYTATLKRNGATVQAYPGIQHHYHGHWATVRTQDDHNHGRRHWATAIPTLNYLFDQAYWKQSRAVPSYDTTNSAVANAKITYSPLSSQEHRADIDGTGSYMGRGILPNCDAITFVRQTPLDFRNSRVNAFAGLHVGQHYRDERTRTRPSETADVANTLVPLLWNPLPASASTFAGLPAPKHAYRGGATSVPNQGGWVAPLGGRGPWSDTTDASHAVAYSVFMYLVEGERYFLETCIDLATYDAHAPNGNEFGGMPFISWYPTVGARTEMSIPNTRYSAIPFTGQERSLGWAANRMAALAFVPDGDIQQPYLKGWNKFCADYLQVCMDYLPPSLKAAGVAHYYASQGSSGTIRSPWMGAFNIQGCCHAFLLTEEAGYKTFAEVTARGNVAIADRSLYDLTMYRWVQSPSMAEYSLSNPYLPASGYLWGPIRTPAVDSVLTPSGDLAPGWVKDGDKLFFLTRDQDAGVVALPSGYALGTPLYAVNVSGTSYSVSTSIGGAPMTLANGNYAVTGEFSGRADISPATNPPFLPTGDTYAPIQEAAFAFAEIAGLSSVPAGTFARVRAFLANANRTTHPTWTLALEPVAGGVPLVQVPALATAEIVWAPTVEAEGAPSVFPPFLASAEALWNPTVAGLTAPALVVVPSFGATEDVGTVVVTYTAAVVIEVGFVDDEDLIWAPNIEGLTGGVDGSLITMEQADKYVLEFYGADHAWFGVAASRKRIALRRATQYLQANYCIQPRYLDPLHKNVIAAAAEAAIRALSGALFEDQNAQHVESVTVGPISRKMSAPRAGGQKRFTVIDQLLRGLTCNSPGMVRFERA